MENVTSFVSAVNGSALTLDAQTNVYAQECYSRKCRPTPKVLFVENDKQCNVAKNFVFLRPFGL